MGNCPHCNRKINNERLEKEIVFTNSSKDKQYVIYSISCKECKKIIGFVPEPEWRG